MNINSNTVVSITYELHTTTPEGQQVFVEKANEDQPLVFLFGVGMMLPKFEEHLLGLTVGDVLLAINGIPIQSPADVVTAASQATRRWSIALVRQGKTVQLRFRL